MVVDAMAHETLTPFTVDIGPGVYASEVVYRAVTGLALRLLVNIINTVPPGGTGGTVIRCACVTALLNSIHCTCGVMTAVFFSDPSPCFPTQ